MLYFDRIGISEGTNINKKRISKGYIIQHYNCFLYEGLKFKEEICNESHDVLMMSVNFDNIAISSINGVGYR